jgi:hypothetical protein
VARVRRNVGWLRTNGWAAWAEEHEWRPVLRARNSLAKSAWRHKQGAVAGGAIPVFLFGVQRSGTNMVVRGLGRRPEVEVHNENDRVAFVQYKLRPDDVIRDVVTRSRHQLVLFKPLCDSNRADHLLDGLGTHAAPRAIWAFRCVDGRVRSEVAKFGDGNRRLLIEFAAGRGDDRWQFRRLSEDSKALIRERDPATLSPEAAAALMWYVRNRLFFDLGLHQRTDTLVVSYDRFVANPRRVTEALCAFLGLGYRADMHDDVAPRPPARPGSLELPGWLSDRCHELETALDECADLALGPFAS